MGSRWLSVLLITACGAGPVGAAELSALPPMGATGLDRGIGSVRCATETEGVHSSSRGAILDVGATATADVLLTTAHGLPPDADTVKRDCRVIVRGKPYVIAEVWHVGGDRAGPEHDWAVVVTRRITGDVHRWRVGQVTSDWLDNAVAQSAPVSLVLRSIDAAQRACRLESGTRDPHRLVAHSCTTYPGMSGSPMVVGLTADPEPVLVAVHIGSQVRWVGTKLEFVSVARPLDAEVTAAIELAAAQTAEIVAAPRTRRRAR